MLTICSTVYEGVCHCVEFGASPNQQLSQHFKNVFFFLSIQRHFSGKLLCTVIRMIIMLNCDFYNHIHMQFCSVWDRSHRLLRISPRSTRAEMATLILASLTDLFLLTDGRSPVSYMLKPVPDAEIERKTKADLLGRIFFNMTRSEPTR